MKVITKQKALQNTPGNWNQIEDKIYCIYNRIDLICDGVVGGVILSVFLPLSLFV